MSFIIHEIYEAASEESFPARLRAPGAYFMIFQVQGEVKYFLSDYFPPKFFEMINHSHSKFAFLRFLLSFHVKSRQPSTRSIRNTLRLKTNTRTS